MLIDTTSHLHDYLTEDFRPMNAEIELGELGLKHISEKSILGNSSLNEDGWINHNFFQKDGFSDLKSLLSLHIKKLLESHQPVSPNFSIEEYHKYVLSDKIHYSVSSWAMLGEVIGVHYGHIKSQMENLLGIELTTKKIEHKGASGHFLGFRIVRPGKSDYNPYHRDAWLPYWRDTVNVWIPICGFENANTISLIPGTHTLDDSEIIKTKQGAVIGDKTYHVPQAVALRKPFKKINPDLTEGEGLIFSPFLLHGNGINKLPDTTRISIELRFCRK